MRDGVSMQSLIEKSELDRKFEIRRYELPRHVKQEQTHWWAVTC